MILEGCLYLALVADVVLDDGPNVLQGGAHLQLETYLVELGHRLVVVYRARQPADVVQRVVAEAVELVHLALVYGVPAKIHGWVSKNGYKLEFDGNGEAFDVSDGSRYRLSNGKVSMISDDTEEK